ncbi:hypothetical protein SPFM12_00262 [Salmonella phage SPFM12]|nr:hypothetical protein SPFM12_00262 [Salmonella phage SPFM12]
MLWNENPAGSVDQNPKMAYRYYVTRTSSIRNTSSYELYTYHYYMVTEHYSGLFLNQRGLTPGVEDVAKKLCTDATINQAFLPPYIGMTLASFLENILKAYRHPPTL